MRQLADASRIRQLMRALGPAANQATRLYFTGGASAVLLGWRATTIDVDLRIVPDTELIHPHTVRHYFGDIEPLLYRYPAIHPPAFRHAVEETLGTRPG